jgi:four helix bundle protein
MEPARSIKELIAWQLGSELSDVVAQMVGKTHSHQNPKLCEQLRASSDSVPANLAEGFGRYYPRENARFVRIAKASLTETQNHLQAGNRRDYWTAADFEKPGASPAGR